MNHFTGPLITEVGGDLQYVGLCLVPSCERLRMRDCELLLLATCPDLFSPGLPYS